MKDVSRNLIVAVGVALILGVSIAATGAKESSPAKALLQLEKKVAARPHVNATQRVKRAVLELAMERAGNALYAGLDKEAQALIEDVEGALRKPADTFANRNPEAAHLSILKPLLTSQHNPYLEAMVQDARRELSKPDVAWPRATSGTPTFAGLGGTRGVRTAGTKMREYFWLFAHAESPMYGQLDILVHDMTFASLTPIVEKYRRENYPATELTFSNRQKEPSHLGELTQFAAGMDFRFVVEIRPVWTTASVDVKLLGNQQLPGIHVCSGRGFVRRRVYACGGDSEKHTNHPAVYEER